VNAAVLLGLGLVGAIGGLAGCKKGGQEIPIEVTGTTVLVDGKEVARAEIRTRPGATVAFHVEGGADLGEEGTADAQGHVTLSAAAPERRYDPKPLSGYVQIIEGNDVVATKDVEIPRRPLLSGPPSDLVCNLHLAGFKSQNAEMYTFGLPEGTRIAIAGAEPAFVIGGESSSVPLAAAAPGVSLTGELSDFDGLSVPFTAELPDGTKYEGTLQAGSRPVLLAFLEPLTGGSPQGVPLPGPGGPSILWLGGERDIPNALEVIGPATSLNEVGRVAVVTLRSEEKGCGQYGESRTAREGHGMTRTLSHAIVKLYDLRTGAPGPEQEFTAEDPGCAEVISKGAASAGSGYANPELIRRWLQAQLAGTPSAP
jgi:hypothetical protein